MNRVDMRDITNLVWEYYCFYRHRSRKILIEDLKRVIIYTETLIKALGG